VRDEVFSGSNVPEALRAAAAALGLREDQLRYVVLNAGSPGGRGLGATPARIAVLLESPALATGPPESRPGAQEQIQEIVRLFGRAADVELLSEVRNEGGGIHVVLSGQGREVLLEEGAEVLRSLEHVLQRAFAEGGLRLRASCEGYREARDEALRSMARELRSAVLADGIPRQTRPLNSYERRIVHLVLSGEPGVRTFSEGDEGARRVVVAPRERAEDGPAGPR
jgi:spoIIIJ-associated protein